MHTVISPERLSSPMLATVRVIRTRNSVYVLTTRRGTHLANLTCTLGTFAGHTYTIDLLRSDTPHEGQPCRFWVVGFFHADENHFGPNYLLTSRVVDLDVT